MDYINGIDAYFEKLKKAIDMVSREELNRVMNVLSDAKNAGKQIFIMGNGGSAATASHYVCDFNKGASLDKEKKFKLICLNDNIPSLMAYANDLSYDDIFVYPLQTYCSEGDIAIGISSSGNSENVVRALKWGKETGLTTIGLTGHYGGQIRQICDYNINVPLDDVQIVEDLHLIFGHCMMKALRMEG